MHISNLEIGSQKRLIRTKLQRKSVVYPKEIRIRHSRMIDRGSHVCRNPYAEYCNVDCCYQASSAPFDFPRCLLLFHHDVDAVNDDLHTTLDLEGPAE